jgi:hypothetical protein
MPPPIILIHRGDSYYLAHTIAQARSSNPDSRLILLGDRSNSFYLGVEHHRYEDYFDEAREFAKLFTYECFPTYQYPWILFCHQKYFALRDFIRAQGVKKFLLIDSDVMIYQDVGAYFEHFAECRMTVSGPPNVNLVHSAFAVVNDGSVVNDICRTFSAMFSICLAALQQQTGASFFYEMVGLHMFSNRSGSGVINTYGRQDAFAISHSVCEDPLFEYNGRIVALLWENNTPHMFDKRIRRWRCCPALHFHGYTKQLMRQHLRLVDKTVRNQHVINRSMSAAVKYPMRMINRLARRDIFPGI